MFSIPMTLHVKMDEREGRVDWRRSRFLQNCRFCTRTFRDFFLLHINYRIFKVHPVEEVEEGEERRENGEERKEREDSREGKKDEDVS